MTTRPCSLAISAANSTGYGLGFAYYKLKNYGPALEHIKTAEQLGKTIDPNLLKAIENKK
jgi:hypothetical protein